MVNLTLFVQMVHFCIAYYLLDRLVLRIAVAQVQQEEQAVAAVQQQITTVTIELAEKTKEHAHEWQHMQQLLSQQKPVVQLPPLVSHKFLPSEEYKPLSRQEIADLAHQMSHSIVRQLAHD